MSLTGTMCFVFGDRSKVVDTAGCLLVVSKCLCAVTLNTLYLPVYTREVLA